MTSLWYISRLLLTLYYMPLNKSNSCLLRGMQDRQLCQMQSYFIGPSTKDYLTSRAGSWVTASSSSIRRHPTISSIRGRPQVTGHTPIRWSSSTGWSSLVAWSSHIASHPWISWLHTWRSSSWVNWSSFHSWTTMLSHVPVSHFKWWNTRASKFTESLITEVSEL